MPNGALIFAHRSSVDYLATARVSAVLVKRHLNLPVCLVTSESVDDPAFDHVIKIAPPVTSNRRYFVVDNQKVVGPWFNESRADALDLTPWDQTLLIDADYFVMGNQLKPIINSNISFACHTRAKDLVTQQLVDTASGYRAMSWATVCWFGHDSRPIFEMWKRIRDQWDYYNHLCDFNQPVFRNDHALSLALDTVGGHVPHQHVIPFVMTNVLSGTKLLDIRSDSTVLFETGKGISRVKNTDLHMIDKSICTNSEWLKKLELVNA
jgi:hypothetical protein